MYRAGNPGIRGLRPVSCVPVEGEEMGGNRVVEIVSGDTANVLLKVGCPQKEKLQKNRMR